MASKRQLSFGGGLISEEFYGRIDQVRNQTGLSILKNFHILKSGALQNRTATTYQSTVFDPRYTVRTRQWVFSTDETYKLEFRPLGLSFWFEGEPILETAKNIQTSITQASPCVVHVTGHSFSVGDKVYLSGIGGMTELNGRYYIVGTVPTNDTFSLLYSGDGTARGTVVDSSAFTAYTSGGTAERVYSITTPYTEDALPDLKFAQSADLMVITCPGYAPRTLVRTTNTSWTLAVLTNSPSTTCPSGVTASVGSAGSLTFEYQVTAVDDHTGIESLPGTSTAYTITAITKANPAVVTLSATHDFATGDEIAMTVAGMTELTGRRFKISVASAYTPDAPITITSISVASPMVVTKNSHGLSDGDKVSFSVAGMTELNDITYGTVTSSAANTFQVYYFGTTTKVASTGFQAFTSGTVTRSSPNPSALNAFTLVGENSTSYGTFTSGTAYPTSKKIYSAATPSTSAPNVLTLNAAATAGVTYNVYKRLGGIFGFIGSTSALTFNDDSSQSPDTLTSTPIYREPFQGSSRWPTCVAFYQGRMVLAGSEANPNGADCSVIGDYTNFTIHSPHQDSDAVQFQTAGYQDSIKDIVPLDKLVVLTNGAEFVVDGGGEGGALTPTETNVKPRTYNGTEGLFPLLIDADVLYLDRGGQVRDFNYAFATDKYQGLNRSLFVPDLLRGHTITDWAYQRNPNSIVWMVREDGVVLSMTYQPDQEMFAWAEHRFYGGTVENVVVVPEGSGETAEDAVYFTVNRTLEDASETRYIERLSPRTFTDVIEANFLDSSKVYDGRNTAATTMTASGSGWTNATALTLTASASTFSSTDVGNEVQMNGVDDDGEDTQIRFRITAYSSATVVTVIPHATVPTTMRAVATTDWALAVDTVSGLSHLNSYTVSIFADRCVVSSALNPVYETKYTVDGDSITFVGDQRYAYIRVGLPITADAKTLAVNPAESGGYVASMKLLNSIDLLLSQTRGIYAGAQEPTDDDENPIEFLYEPKIRDAEVLGEPTALKTGPATVPTKARWETNGSVFVRMLEPLPCTITSLVAQGALY